MEIKKLYELLAQDNAQGVLGDKIYWNELWDHYVEEKSADYKSLDVKEGISRFISDQNLRMRRNATNCDPR